jgi:YesN/AraC family two-component response regulator
MLYQGEPDTAGHVAGAAIGLLLKPLAESVLIETLEDLGSREPGGSILIVEDDPQLRALHRRMIAEHFPDYTIQDVGDGRAALDLLTRETPSLIVLDLVMPEVDGFAVLEALRANPRTAVVPVLVLSGKALTADDIGRLSEARVIYQTKEVLTESELAETLRRTLGRADLLPPHTSALVKGAVAFIQQHHNEPLSRQEIADAIGVSKDYLGRIFHQELGLSPWEYLIRYRVLRAKELLRTTGYSVAEVATRVGFDTPTYFSHIFHREVGCSPRAFRAQITR